METPKLTVHQVWLGNEMPEETKKLIEKSYKVCLKAGYDYKYWRLPDIIEQFKGDYAYYFWTRLFNLIPFAPIFAAAVDYYKWRILAMTPEDEYAIYMDCDVEMRSKKKKDFVIPLTQALISFGSTEQYGSPAVSYIQVHGGEAAGIAAALADKKIEEFGMDSSHFLEDVIRCFGNGRRNSRLSLGASWIQEDLIKAFDEHHTEAEVAPMDVFGYYGQSPDTLLLHRTWHLATEGKATDDEITEYEKDKLQKVKEIELNFNKTKPRVLVLMSSARTYDENLDRTLGILTTTDIRTVQRATTFKNLPETADYYFVVGNAGEKEEGLLDNSAPDILYVGDPEGKAYEAKRLYTAMRWCVENMIFENLFFCEDDNYVHMERLMRYCNVKAPDDLVCVGAVCKEHPCVKGGLLITAALARKIALLDPDPPKDGEEFGNWIGHCLEVLGAEFVHEYKLSETKSQFPAPTNARITTHECNPYDLVALDRLNSQKPNA